MEIGAQLYTVRSLCQTPEGLSDTLKKVADIGYRTVQLSGTCEYDAQQLRAELDRLGLRCVLTHIPVPRLTGDMTGVLRDHEALDCPYIGLGWYSHDASQGDTLERFDQLFRPAACAIRGAGRLFMVHNHDQEFRRVDGMTILEHLVRRYPADMLGVTLDTFWVQAGGGDPAQWLENLAGRVPCIHLKDYAYGRRMAVLGEGNLNFDRILACAEKAGTKYMLVEQDDCYGEDPIECLRRSYQYLRARGFA